MPPSSTDIAVTVEIGLLLAGLVLLWRLALSPEARARPRVVALAPWQALPSDFFLFLWLIMGGGFAAALIVGQVFAHFPLAPDAKAAAATAAGQLGMLAGIAAYRIFFDRHKTPADPRPGFFRSGLITFVIALPVVTVVSLLWQGLLVLCGLPPEKQDLIRMFTEADSRALLVTMILLACIGAPVVEELIFRGGIFRWVRTRLPRWAALLLPACLFAALHQNLTSFAPLVALGILFSLAYERTGHIGTTIVAHAWFNLNSVLLILANVGV